MKKILVSICFVVAMSVLCPVESFSSMNTFIPNNISSDDYRYIYVTLDVYDAETGEFKRSDKDAKVRVRNGIYEIKFVYGWIKCSRSNKRGYDFYCKDAVNIYYFAL